MAAGDLRALAPKPKSKLAGLAPRKAAATPPADEPAGEHGPVDFARQFGHRFLAHLNALPSYIPRVEAMGLKLAQEAKEGSLVGRVAQAVSPVVGLGSMLPEGVLEKGQKLAAGVGSMLKGAAEGEPSMLPKMLPSIDAVPGMEDSVASTSGDVAGGLVEALGMTAALGPGAVPAIAGSFGGQSMVDSYEQAKKGGATEEQAWLNAIPKGALSATVAGLLPGIAAKINVFSGGGFMGAVKNVLGQAAAGVGMGQAEQTLRNIVDRHTTEPDKRVLTGLKGRAATDAVVGIFMGLIGGRGPHGAEKIEGNEILAPGDLSRKSFATAPEPEITLARHPIDERLADHQTRADLEAMAKSAGWADVGGQVTKDPQTGERSRTHWAAKDEWWLDKPTDMTEAEVKAMVAKVTSDNPGRIGARQRELLTWMLDTIESERRPPWSPEVEAAAAGVVEDAPPVIGPKAMRRALAGEEMQPPKSPPEQLEIPDMGAEPSQRDLFHKWIGERQEAQGWAMVEAAKKRNELKALAPEGFGRMFKMPGTQEADRLNQALQLYIDTKGKLDSALERTHDRLPAEVHELLKRVANLTEEQRALGDRIIAENAEFGQTLRDADIIRSTVENYTKRLWKPKVESAVPPTGRAKFATDTAGRLARSYDTLLDGLADGRELAVRGAVDAQLYNRMVGTQVMADRNFMKAGEKAGLLSTTPATRKEGYVQIEHPNFRQWKMVAQLDLPDDLVMGKADHVDLFGQILPEQRENLIKQYGHDVWVTPDGSVMQKVPVFAEPKLARSVNAVLNRSTLRDIPGFNPVMEVNRAIRNSIVLSGLDTHIFKSLDYVLNTPFRKFREANPITAYRDGMKMIQGYEPDLQMVVRNGGTLSVMPDFTELYTQEQGRISKMLDRIKVTVAPRAFLENVWQSEKDFLFSRYLPGLKAQLMVLEYRRLQKQYASELRSGSKSLDELAEVAGKLANNVMAGQNLQRMARNPEAQDLLRATAFTPDWIESDVRRAVNFFNSGAVGAAHRQMWGRMLGRYFTMYAALNIATATMENPQDPGGQAYKNFLRAWKKGNGRWLDWDITPILSSLGREKPDRVHIGIIGGARSAFSIGDNPVGYVVGRTSPLVKWIGQAMTGENGIGQRFTTWRENRGIDERGAYQTSKLGQHLAGQEKGGQLAGETASYRSAADPGALNWEQLPSFLESQAFEATPVWSQAVADWMTGQMDGWEASLRAIGFKTSVTKDRK